jgi:hypothetical protein
MNAVSHNSTRNGDLGAYLHTFTIPFQETSIVTPIFNSKRTQSSKSFKNKINAIRTNSLTSLHSGARDADMMRDGDFERPSYDANLMSIVSRNCHLP